MQKKTLEERARELGISLQTLKEQMKRKREQNKIDKAKRDLQSKVKDGTQEQEIKNRTGQKRIKSPTV